MVAVPVVVDYNVNKGRDKPSIVCMVSEQAIELHCIASQIVTHRIATACVPSKAARTPET